jgi:hypothetical protein
MQANIRKIKWWQHKMSSFPFCKNKKKNDQ